MEQIFVSGENGVGKPISNLGKVVRVSLCVNAIEKVNKEIVNIRLVYVFSLRGTTNVKEGKLLITLPLRLNGRAKFGYTHSHIFQELGNA